MSWNVAKKVCEAEPDFRLARIEKLTTFAFIGRQLEQWVNDNKAMDTWYWVDATYNEDLQRYEWGGDKNKPLAFTNFFYRYPRPIGVGSHLNYRGMYLVREKEEQCLTLALPLPGLATTTTRSGQTIYGHSTTFDERSCVSSQKRRAMCESTLPDCNPIINDPFTLTEGLTISQFWTTWTYEVEEKGLSKFYDENHIQMAERMAFVFTNGTEFAEGRSSKFDTTFCVTMQVSYEFRKSQLPCPSPDQIDACYWNFIQYVPANCNNVQGVICEHEDSARRKCTWLSNWISNPDSFLMDPNQATIGFGYAGNIVTMRSRYKQTFGSLLCKRHFQMARHSSRNWYMKPGNDSIALYKYDYMETYWVVDEEGFKKDVNSKCKVSRPADATGFTRVLQEVSCSDWHYYICERLTVPSTKPQPIPYPIPKTTGWNQDRHARIYPIIS
ncbi:unnamed protein product [Orchesella dallaii]|uniref:C-type lectin domain-containing protein n=1 Tax=Orchesella dallaii TaxID=48710 RepID=A0ABP1Q7D6_9HEXA